MGKGHTVEVISEVEHSSPARKLTLQEQMVRLLHVNTVVHSDIL